MKEQSQLSPWQAWSALVQQRLDQQQAAIIQLESQLSELNAQLGKLAARPAYNIESIQYHFDQLKVEKLEGTLNIGMTAPGSGEDLVPGSIEQFTVGNKGQQFPSAQPAITPPEEPYNDIFRKINGFLDAEAIRYLQSYEQELSLPLDPYHRQIVIEDLRKQMPQRIHYYLERMSQEDKEALSAYPNLLIERVFEKTKMDAESAIGSYMRQLKAAGSTDEGVK